MLNNVTPQDFSKTLCALSARIHSQEEPLEQLVHALYAWFKGLNQQPIILCGEPGCGKSMTIDMVLKTQSFRFPHVLHLDAGVLGPLPGMLQQSAHDLLTNALPVNYRGLVCLVVDDADCATEYDLYGMQEVLFHHRQTRPILCFFVCRFKPVSLYGTVVLMNNVNYRAVGMMHDE